MVKKTESDLNITLPTKSIDLVRSDAKEFGKTNGGIVDAALGLLPVEKSKRAKIYHKVPNKGKGRPVKV